VEDILNSAAVEGLNDVDLAELKAGFVPKVFQVARATGDEIIGRNNGVPVCKQRIAEVGTQEPGTACN
jgi:hypothetical protein